MQDEATDVVRVGIELVVASIFLFLLVGTAITGRNWYRKEEYHKYETQYMAETSPNWTFESVAKKGTTVSGNDIVDFIVKNDTRYDYVIGTGEFLTDNKNDISQIGTDKYAAVSNNPVYKFDSDDTVTTEGHIRIYNREYMDHMARPFYIFSERYLLNTANMGAHLEDRFRVYTIRNNGDIVLYYFLLDPDVKNPERDVR